MIAKILVIVIILLGIFAGCIYLFSSPKTYVEMNAFAQDYIQNLCNISLKNQSIFSSLPVTYQEDTAFVASLEQYLKKCLKYIPANTVYRQINKSNVVEVQGKPINLSDLNPFSSEFRTYGYISTGDGNADGNKIILDVSCVFKGCQVKSIITTQIYGHNIDPGIEGFSAVSK